MKATISVALLSLAACREQAHPEIIVPPAAVAAHFLGTAAVANAVAAVAKKAPAPPPVPETHSEGSHDRADR